MKEHKKEINDLPFKEIGDFPKLYSLGNVIKRFIDGIGYRYYWATESLIEADLQFKASEDSRTSLETLEHILDATGFILRITQGKYNTLIIKKEELEFKEVRRQTLNELSEISRLMGGLVMKNLNH